MNEIITDEKVAKELEDHSEKYEKHYSEEGLMNKLAKWSKKAGMKVVYAALLLYYVLLSKDVPIKEKRLIIGALGYLILPIDFIPDTIPVLGFSDDLAALLFAVRTIRNYITPEIEAQAKEKLKDWFGSIDGEEIESVLK